MQTVTIRTKKEVGRKGLGKRGFFTASAALLYAWRKRSSKKLSGWEDTKAIRKWREQR